MNWKRFIRSYYARYGIVIVIMVPMLYWAAWTVSNAFPWPGFWLMTQVLLGIGLWCGVMLIVLEFRLVNRDAKRPE